MPAIRSRHSLSSSICLPHERATKTYHSLDATPDLRRNPFKFLLPTSSTAIFMESYQSENGNEGLCHRRIVGVRCHNVSHMGPPALHDRMAGQVIHPMICQPPQNSEQGSSLLVEMDGVVLDTCILKKPDKLRPNLIMAAAVFLLHAGIELHLERVVFTGAHAATFERMRRMTIGSAITRISSRSMKIDMTSP